MRELVERAYFLLCLALGRLLRSGRYSRARIVSQDGELQVRKYRFFYAPLLIWIGGPLVRILNTGVRVLPQRDWEERERQVYRSLRGTSIRIDADGVLMLPCLAGETLATLLEDPELEESVRKRAIERAVAALAEFHDLGFTHGDAMAENVLVDLEAGVARWFDFETIHDSSRPLAWRRADDVRALLVTCLVRTVPEKRAETLQLILDVYPDEGTTRLLDTSFTSVFRRPLAFHLAQAGLSLHCFREVARLLRERLGEEPGGGLRSDSLVTNHPASHHHPLRSYNRRWPTEAKNRVTYMPRTLNSTAHRAELIERLARLDPDQSPRWGSLTAPRMLAHLCDQMRMTLSAESLPPIPGPTHYPVLRELFLYVLPWPKGSIQGPPEAFEADPAAWAQDLATLNELVDQFLGLDPDRDWPDHPHFGRMNQRAWAAFSHKHFDHHLQQFGV